MLADGDRRKQRQKSENIKYVFCSNPNYAHHGDVWTHVCFKTQNIGLEAVRTYMRGRVSAHICAVCDARSIFEYLTSEIQLVDLSRAIALTCHQNLLSDKFAYFRTSLKVL